MTWKKILYLTLFVCKVFLFMILSIKFINLLKHDNLNIGKILNIRIQLINGIKYKKSFRLFWY